MDLISREAIHEREITNPENDYEYGWNEALAEIDVHIPSAFNGMTNGEVLKSIFPTAELILGSSDHLPDVFSAKEEWWNTLYSTMRK